MHFRRHPGHSSELQHPTIVKRKRNDGRTLDDDGKLLDINYF